MLHAAIAWNPRRLGGLLGTGIVGQLLREEGQSFQRQGRETAKERKILDAKAAKDASNP
jgi:hypothetical protein